MVVNLVQSELPKHICYRRSVPLIKVACYQHSIFLARPLQELWTHIRHNKLPSFALIARTIKVLALGIFQGHLCDYMLLACYEGFCHSIGEEKVVEDIYILERNYPYIIESAILLQFKDPRQFLNRRLSFYIHEEININEIKEVTVKTITEYYQKHKKLEILMKAKTMRNFMYSPFFQSSG